MLLITDPQPIPQGVALPLVSTIAAMRAAVLHKRLPMPPVGLEKEGACGWAGRQAGRCGGMAACLWQTACGETGMVQVCAGEERQVLDTIPAQIYTEEGGHHSPPHTGWVGGAQAAGCHRASGSSVARAPLAAWHNPPAAWQLLHCTAALAQKHGLPPLRGAATAAVHAAAVAAAAAVRLGDAPALWLAASLWEPPQVGRRGRQRGEAVPSPRSPPLAGLPAAAAPHKR